MTVRAAFTESHIHWSSIRKIGCQKSAPGVTEVNHSRTVAAFSCRYPSQASQVFDIPPGLALRSASISVGSSLLVLPRLPRVWPTYFLIFPFFSFSPSLRRVTLARCFSHYSGSGYRPNMIAPQTLPLSLTLIVSFYGSHTRACARTHTGPVYMDELGDTSSARQQINHRTNWQICHRRGCL